MVTAGPLADDGVDRRGGVATGLLVGFAVPAGEVQEVKEEVDQGGAVGVGDTGQGLSQGIDFGPREAGVSVFDGLGTAEGLAVEVPLAHPLDLVGDAAGPVLQVGVDVLADVSAVHGPAGEFGGGDLGGLVAEPDEVSGKVLQDGVPRAGYADAERQEFFGVGGLADAVSDEPEVAFVVEAVDGCADDRSSGETAAGVS